MPPRTLTNKDCWTFGSRLASLRELVTTLQEASATDRTILLVFHEFIKNPYPEPCLETVRQEFPKLVPWVIPMMELVIEHDLQLSELIEGMAGNVLEEFASQFSDKELANNMLFSNILYLVFTENDYLNALLATHKPREDTLNERQIARIQSVEKKSLQTRYLFHSISRLDDPDREILRLSWLSDNAWRQPYEGVPDFSDILEPIKMLVALFFKYNIDFAWIVREVMVDLQHAAELAGFEPHFIPYLINAILRHNEYIDGIRDDEIEVHAWLYWAARDNSGVKLG